MRTEIGILASIFFMSILLSSCITHVTKDMADELKQEDLYASYGTKIQDYGHFSKCLNLSVKIVDAEKINSENKFCSPDLITNCYVLNPKEINYHIINYMNGAYEKRGVKIDSNSTKIIKISVPNVELHDGFFNRSATLQVRVDIPEIKFMKDFTATEKTGGTYMYRPLVYSIHEVTQKIVEDVAIKSYILCQ